MAEEAESFLERMDIFPFLGEIQNITTDWEEKVKVHTVVCYVIVNAGPSPE